jgi:hypothetical protein
MNFYPVSHLYEFTPEAKSGQRRNPLSHVGALDQAEFIDMRVSAQRSRAGILCDIQWCKDFEGSNTALVVLIGIEKLVWTNDDSKRQRSWHTQYGDWKPKTSGSSKPALRPASGDGGEDTWARDAALGPHDAEIASTADEVAAQSRYVLEFGRLSVSALRAHLYVGHIQGLDGPPPDMGVLSDAEIIAGFPQWSSVLDVREHYVYPDPAVTPDIENHS